MQNNETIDLARWRKYAIRTFYDIVFLDRDVQIATKVTQGCLYVAMIIVGPEIGRFVNAFGQE